MSGWRGSAILAAAFAAVVDVACCPFAAPVVSSLAVGKPVDWLGLLDSVGLDSWISFWAAGLWLEYLPAILIVLVVLFLAFFCYIALKESASRREVEKGIFGDSQIVCSVSELNRRNDFWDGKGTPKNAGLVIGASERGFWFDSSIPHALTCGKTGSGKSQLMVLESLNLLFAAGWNVISTGKPEILELTADKARKLGYEVVLLDLSGYPGASGYNPLSLVVEALEENDTDTAVKVARQIAVDLVPIGGEKNTYFPKAARNLVAACILIVCASDAKREEKNLASVAALIERGTAGEDPKDPSAPLKGYIRSLGPQHSAFSLASDFLGDGGVTTAGKNVLSTAKEALSIFSDKGLRAVTSESTVSIRDLIERKTVVYIEMLDEGDPYGVVYTCFLNQWWQVAQKARKANGGCMPHETAILGDEIGNLNVKVACLPAIATLGRSMGIHEYLFVQNLKQLNAYNEPGDGGAGRASSGRSYSETAVPLINEWEWQHRVAIRDGLVAIKGGENSKPGREGVFEFPLAYANRTPAGAFFGLGDEEAERRKKADYYSRAMAKAGKEGHWLPDVWCPDFENDEDEEDEKKQPAEDDEWSAWDE